MSFIKLGQELYRKNFYTIAIDSIQSREFGATVDLRDEGGNHICELHLFKSEEDAGQEARAYWEEYLHGDRASAIELLGVDTLLSWAYGELGGPGSTKVKNLEDWLDLYLDDPSEHFEEGPFEIELVGENIVEELGFKPTTAFSMG